MLSAAPCWRVECEFVSCGQCLGKHLVFCSMSKVHRSLCRSSWIAVLAAFAGTMLSCCTSPGAFRNVPRNQPHAVLITAERDYTIFTPTLESVVRTINGQPVDHADRRNRYRIPPGATVIVPGMEHNLTPYDPMQFTAVAGRHYVLRPPIKGIWMNLYDYPPSPAKTTKGRILARSAPTGDFRPSGRRNKL